METDRLTERLGSEPIVSIKPSVTIHSVNFDAHGHGDGDGTCKQALRTGNREEEIC